MNNLKGRYLAFILGVYLVLFAIPLWMPECAGLPSVLLAVAVFLASSGMFFFRGRRTHAGKRTAGLIAVLFILTSCAVLYGNLFVSRTLMPMSALIDGETHGVCGYVDEVIYEKPYGASYRVVLETADGEERSGKIMLTTPYAAELSAGDEIAFDGVFSALESEYESYHRSRGVYAAAEAENVTVTGRHERPIHTFLGNFRAYFAESFEKNIGGDAAGFATALLTGERDDLSGRTKLAFQRLGISHLLAVSGLHLSVIVGGFDLLLRALTVPKRKKNVILIVGTLFFAAICGFGASVMRAAVMLCMLYLGELLGEKSDSMTSLFLAAALIVTVRPSAMYDAGLWLAFFSTFGILAVMPFWNGFFPAKEEDGALVFMGKRFLRALLALVMMNFTALCFTMPITYLLYGGVSLISPLANLIFVPTVQMLLYLVVILALCSPIPFLAPFLGKLIAVLIGLLTDIAHRMSDVEGIYLSLCYPFAKYIIAVLIIGVTAVLAIKRCKPVWTLSVFLACAIAFGGCYVVFRDMTAGRTEAFLVTDGNSDVVGIVSDGEAVLIDITTGGYAMPKTAVENLAAHFECEVDALVLTHLHSYHAGSLSKLSQSVKIHRILIPAPKTEAEEAIVDRIFEAVGDSAEIEMYVRGETVQTAELSSVTLRLPTDEILSRSTHPVVTFSVDIHGMPWEREIAYIGSGGFETARALSDTPLVICGSHGPVTKHIFEYTALSSAQTVIFADSDVAAFTETDLLCGDVIFAEDICEIVFE